MHRRTDPLLRTVRPAAMQTMRFGSQRKPRHDGFTLVEVLVSIVILSIGVLGTVGLQAAALQANRDARLQSSAARLARELGDMMRGNKNVAIATTAAANPYLIDFDGTVPPIVQDCFKAACTLPVNVAHFEVRDWLRRIDAELPGLRVVSCFDARPYDAAGLPRWACTGDGGVTVVKIGWTRGSTNRSATAAASAVVRAIDAPPAIVLSLIAGSVS